MTPYFVAEVSCNHLGSLDRALRLVDVAAQAGANAVKFQCWSEMTVCDHILPDGPWAGRNLVDLYREAKAPWDWFPTLFERAKEQGITAFSSVFDLKALEYLESIGCPMYKISSFEIGDLELIRAVAETGKPMVLSAGMATHQEITRAVEKVWGVYFHYNVTIMKCSSAYPAPLSSLNLSTIPRMADHEEAVRDEPFCFGLNIGFSDHTLGHVAAMTATALGATMIEKHLTLQRSDGGPDAAFSAEPGEFWEMVQRCKEVAECLGKPELGATPAELPQTSLKRSLYYAQDVSRGTQIQRGAIVTARPALGIEPYHLPTILGRTLNCDVKRGEPVRMEHFG